jgi:two-component system, cell cycle response regulator CtrA
LAQIRLISEFPMRVLLVEDDAANAASIRMMLRRENFLCDTAGLETLGSDVAKFYDYDFVVLDPAPRGDDAFEVLHRLRAAHLRMPMLLLSGSSETERMIERIGFSAEDYLSKPFHRRQLTARIQGIVQRWRGQPGAIVRTGKLLVNLTARRVEVDGRGVPLTGKEFAVLELLSRLKGTTLTKGMLLSHLYAGTEDPGLKILDVFVCKLRKKLAQATGGEHYIETVRGRGYVMRDPMSMVAAA